MKQHEKAIAAGKRSIELHPNDAFMHRLLGYSLCWAGRRDEGIKHFKLGMRLNPFPDYLDYVGLGMCYQIKGSIRKRVG